MTVRPVLFINRGKTRESREQMVAPLLIKIIHNLYVSRNNLVIVVNAKNSGVLTPVYVNGKETREFRK